MSEQVELLFFDTFAHDNTEEINLDLVQFPKPVYVNEVRIIPLGARVQADFPGGVRLGATNPSQFQIDFFVNDLAKPGASTFETLGGFEYDQNGCINLECSIDETTRKIPTDGLVLKGWYTTITLAVYGTLTNNITEQIIQPHVPPVPPSQTNTITEVPQICPTPTLEPEWPQENIPVAPVEYNAQQATPYQPYNQNEQPYNQEFVEYYDVPKDPRSYHQTPETEWDTKTRTRDTERDNRDRERSRDLTYQKTGGSDREHPREDADRRDREKRYSRSEDRDRQSREFRDSERDREHELEWSEDYRSEHGNHEWNDRERDRGHERERDRCYKHDDNYRRSYTRGEERDERKHPRTPPMHSPKRPRSPHVVDIDTISSEKDNTPKEDVKEEQVVASPSKEFKESTTPPVEEPVQMDVEEFEPILSDEDILDDMEHYQDMDYDYTAYTNNDDIIKLFTPGTSELMKYPKSRNFAIKNNRIEIEDAFKVSIGIADDYFKSSITKYELHTFDKLNTEIKEEFIHLSEKLITTIGSSSVFCDIAKLHVAVKSMNPQGLSAEDKELAEQLDFIIETLTDWLKISLSYDMANIQDQPAYKIRHIKCGVKLADWCATSVEYITLLWQKNFNMHKELLHLFDQEFMALSIKLMILKALDTYLLHKFAIEKFLNDSSKENGYYDTLPVSERNGYKILVEHLRRNPLVRVKFALISILKKLNLYEILHKMHSILLKLRNSAHDVSAEDINLITKSLNEILNYCISGPFTLSQPKRFLPVSSQFEIHRIGTYDILVQFFKMFSLLQCFVLLLTYPSTLNLPLIKTAIFEIVANLLENYEGLIYLSENIETINVLLKCLLRSDEEIQYNMQECLDVKSHHLGLNLAYKLQALYHIEYLLANGRKLDCDAPEIVDNLHSLLCLTFSHFGKVACAQVLGMHNHINCLLQFLEVLFFRERSETFIAKTKKSIGLAYVIDLLFFSMSVVPNVQLMERNIKLLIHLIDQQGLFEDSVEHKLNEMRPYLVPFETGTLHYDNIAPYLTVIEKSYENFMYDMGPIITSLRIIAHLGVRSQSSVAITENPFSSYAELKYKHVILQLFSLDGTTVLFKLLQKICEYYFQPSTHTSVFVSNQGWQILNIIHPSILLLKHTLSYVIQCRNTNFKDLTAIPVFLETFNLLNSYPNTAAGYYLAQKIKVDIIDILLVYTQPMSEEVNEKDSLSKTLWTQMCGEVVKYITSSPHTFISGLLIFSELLPLPLPVQAIDDLDKEELSWIVNLRKLWSAHLHPHSAIIQEMVNKLCISTQPQLLNLLRRICVQLSDLAANSAIMVSRGILDNLCNLIIPKEESKSGPCDSHVAKLLNFFACLVTHNTIKSAVLHLIHSNSTVTLKTDEKYSSLIPAFSQILKVNSTINSHIHSQECILSIIQSFCDIEITVMQNPITSSRPLSSEEYLANAMPVREHLLVFLNMMWEHLSNSNNSFVTYLPIVRTFILLTEHDYGFYHLREYLLKKSEVVVALLNKLASSFLKTNAEYLSTLNTLIEFLRVCVVYDEVNEPNLLYSPRKMKLSLVELKTVVGWPSDSKPESHPLMTLEEILKETLKDNNTFETLLEGVSSLLKLLEEETPAEKSQKEAYNEITLPVPESLLVQFACRTIYSSVDACDERLTSRYWLATPSDEAENELETISCDLLDVCRQNIRPDYNISKEVERLCRISCAENIDDKEKRCIDVNPNMKKPFVTPMRARGFARSAPQRSDLFRSRPPNTSRPPSLHVDDFVALETCGAQPTGPTGYNKISRELASRIARGSRGRAFVTSERSVQHRQTQWWGTGMGRSHYQL